jgi:phosphoribosylformylglycinamidine synthase II
MRVYVDAVHRREPNMEPFEVMISESQERMLAVVEPEKVGEVMATCTRWELSARVVGEVTKTGRVEVVAGDEVLADVPADALAEEAPVYDRDRRRPEWLDALRAAAPGDEPPGDLRLALLQLLSSPTEASKRWVWEQYDHMIFLGTIRGPGGDAAVIRLPGRREGVAITVDGPGRYCYLDPYQGARLAVAEAARNVAVTGARSVAVTNCLNFGSPEKSGVMWQFAEAVRGIGDACRTLGTPVTGGNVSFYNETSGQAIFPTPVIGMLGVIEDASRAVGHAWRSEDDAVVLVGRTDPGDFGGSEFAKVVNSTIGGRPPALDLEREKRLHEFLFRAADRGLLASAHDLSSGGLAVALAEASIAGGVGVEVDRVEGEPHRALFSESPSRAVISCRPENSDDAIAMAAELDIEAHRIGVVGGSHLRFGEMTIGLREASEAYQVALPRSLSDTL